MVDMAEDPSLFTYLRDSKADVETVVGDGRLRLAARPSHTYDVIVLDAFSSDSIPVHLLTREAMDMYADRLVDDGILVVHITNRMFDLEPVLAAAAEEHGWSGAVGERSAQEPGATDSRWAVLSSDRQVTDELTTVVGWRPLEAGHQVAWTDDYSSVLSVLR